MEEIKLEAQIRDEIGKGKLAGLRRTGFIPAVVYGEGKKSLSIKINRSDLIHLLHTQHAENIIVTLNIKGEKSKAKDSDSRTALIKEIKYHPIKDDILHVDFYQISLTQKIQVKVPLKTKGEAIGVKQDGGTLDHLLWELDVECLPTQIPQEIVADVSGLKIGDAIHIKDLTVPEGVKLLHDPQVIALSVSPPIKEEVVAAEAVVGAEAATQEPEVIKEKKEVPEEEAEEVAPAKAKEKEKEKEK